MSEEMMGIPDIIGDLEAAAKKGGGFSNDVKVFNMKNWDNHGRVYIAPINGPTKDDAAIKQLNGLIIVERWLSGKKKDGSDYGFVDKQYFSLDSKFYGELTEDQRQIHERIKSKISAVPKTCQGVYKKTVTLIQGHVVQHTKHKETTKMVCEGSPAVYAFQSKNFEKSLTGAIQGMVVKMKNYEWYHALCSRSLTKTRYIDMVCYMDPDVGAGYQTSVNFAKFDEDAVNLTGGTIGLDLSSKGEDYLEKFGNPVKRWLDIPQDKPLFDIEYLAELEASLNSFIKGENPHVVVNFDESGEASKPNSNAGFKDLDTAINTQVTDSVADTIPTDAPF